MKKFLIVVFIFLTFCANAISLRGGVSEEYIPNGFFGSWGVISKLDNSNNPKFFNMESRDIWTLSGYGDTLILQNLNSGAHSEIKIKEKNKDGKTLKFTRIREVEFEEGKIVYQEIVSFVLSGKNFTGVDNFIVTKYDKNNNVIEKNEAKYNIAGVKISGSLPI